VEAIILAGGKGTRLQSVVSDVPKPMAPIGGRPFLELILEPLGRQGIDRAILSVGYKWHSIRQYFGTRYQNMALDYAVEPTPLGTGGGLARASGLLSPATHFIAVNGDTYFDVDIGRLRNVAREKSADLAIALTRMSPGERYSAVKVAAEGVIEAFSADASAGGFANGGVYVFARRLVADMCDKAYSSLENDWIPRWLSAQRRLIGIRCGGRFVDIGVPEDYRKAVALFDNRNKELIDGTPRA
jgi:D-glycero-alpha-D-manno-heptose 1-phosphate guanylyltransferase